MMEFLENACTCRICLTDGAIISIFDNEDNKTYKDTLTKMNLCFGVIPDLPGYPRHLCMTCYHSLDKAVAFINKYKETCKLLEENLKLVIKLEDSDPNELDNNTSEPEVEIRYCKDDNVYIKLDLLKEESAGIFYEYLSHKSEDQELKDEPRNILDSKLKTSGNMVTKKSTKSAGRTRVEQNREKHLSLSTRKKAVSKRVKESVKKKDARPKKDLKEITEKRINQNKRKPTCNSVMCELCGKTFNTNYNYVRHKTTHLPEKSHICPICSKSYSCSDYLNGHIRKAHDKNTYICADCGKVYSNRSPFLAHLKWSHQNRKRKYKLYPCTMCDKQFTSIKSSIIHERSAHTGDRPAVCKVCDASFYHESYLNEHMRLHTGETPFKCPICDKGFAQRGNMKSHMRHNHSISKLSEETLKKLKPTLLKHLKP